ncbi:response regulator transcription factor [Roseovarius tibetensis]|uniref:response regulator transcription factor n=1 Tax=Roseovarius tibetensis TaxID=2685897 RepID=UPI003D7F3A5C
MTVSDGPPDRILIVEDDPGIAAFLAKGLRKEGFDVDIDATGEALVDRVRAGRFRLVVLDRMLPDVDGADLCRQLRDAGDDTMVLMLTAKDALVDKLDGLNAGADDYLTKPFAFDEFLARLQALLRRAPQPDANTVLRITDLMIDVTRKRAERGGRDLQLTATEFRLLQYLAENAGNVLSRADLLKAVWDYEFDPQTNVVEVYITYLRRKLDLGADVKLIRNHRGFGYYLGVD